MSGEWYYLIMGEEVGPISASDLKTRADTGVINRDTLVRKGAVGEWVLAEGIRGLFDTILGAPTTPPAQPLPGGPRRFRTAHVPEEGTQLQRACITIAARYRWHNRISGYANVGILGMCLPVLFSRWVTFPVWFYATGCVFFIVALGLTFTERLVCPGCGGNMLYKFGPFCPECGAAGFPESSFWLGKRIECHFCGRTCWVGKGRFYTIRACTHCGLVVDEKGL